MSISETRFGTLPDGREAALYTLENGSGTVLEATNYGCRIHRLLVRDKSGQLGDVVLGHRTFRNILGKTTRGLWWGVTQTVSVALCSS